MNLYYQLRLSSDPSVIGVSNGIQQVEIQDGGGGSQPSLDDVVHFFCRDTRVSEKLLDPPFVLDFSCVKPLKRAILTDFLSYGPFLRSCPFMMSESAVGVFSLFKIQECRFYNSTVIKDASAISYKMLYCPALGYDVLDFQLGNR
jgi:hypothetical protein